MFAAKDKNIMDASSEKQVSWHFEILPRSTKRALDFLSKEKWLEKSEWYLAGGTALALLAGNRKSFDLDFFQNGAILMKKNFSLIFPKQSSGKQPLKKKIQFMASCLMPK